MTYYFVRSKPCHDTPTFLQPRVHIHIAMNTTPFSLSDTPAGSLRQQNTHPIPAIYICFVLHKIYYISTPPSYPRLHRSLVNFVPTIEVSFRLKLYNAPLFLHPSRSCKQIYWRYLGPRVAVYTVVPLLLSPHQPPLRRTATHFLTCRFLLGGWFGWFANDLIKLHNAKTHTHTHKRHAQPRPGDSRHRLTAGKMPHVYILKNAKPPLARIKI